MKKFFSLLLLLLHLTYLYASPPTLHDITETPVPLYPGASITIDSIRPEHFYTITADAIKNEVGDINGNGINDIVIKRSNEFWVLYGAPGGFKDYPEKSQIDEKDGFQIKFSEADSYSLLDVGFIGDINGDGLADLLAVLASPVSGKPRKAYIIYGAKKFPSIFDESQATKALFPDNSLSWDEYSTHALSFGDLGDINGDGVDDFFINSFQLNIFFGNKALPLLKENSAEFQELKTSFSITSESPSPTTTKVCFGYGATITRAGDFNADGFADILLSTKCFNSDYATSDSKVYVIYGQETFPDTFPLKFLNNPGYPNALIIEPQTTRDFFGSAVAPIGDFNGDSISDIMVSSMFLGKDQTDNLLGGTYIFFGKKSFTGTLSSGYFESHDDVGIFIPGVGYNIAGIGDLNSDGLADVLLAKNSFASVIYGSPTLPKELPLTSLDGSNGFNLTLISPELKSSSLKTGIQSIVGLNDTNGDSKLDFAFTYGDGKYRIITKDLPKATACIDALYCLKSDANMYLDSMFCNGEIPTTPTTPETDENHQEEEANNNKTNTTTILSEYNPLTHGIYDKSLETVVRKDSMSPSTAALCGTAIGVGTCVAAFLVFTFTRKWYTESNYVQLDEQVPDWSEDSRKVKIYKIEEAIKNRFKCYQCLLWSLLVIEALSILGLIVDMNGFDGHFIVGFVLHGFKIMAFARAIEAYKKEALEKQKMTVFGMKVLLILAGIFLVVHAVALYQEVKYYWNLPETGIQFALSLLMVGFFTIGSQVLVYLYAKKFLKLLEKREELRSHLQNSQVDIPSREQEFSNA